MKFGSGKMENRLTTMRLGQFGISLVYLLGAANAFAGPWQSRGEGREAVRTFQVQNIAMDREPRPMPAPNQQQVDRSRGRLLGLPGSAYGAPPDNQTNGSQDNGRRPGRLSPEERRALRRQIDEAGHDIYKR